MKYLLAILFIATLSYANACDICGCAIGGYQFGILPNYRQHYISLKYQYQHFHSFHTGEQSQADDYISQAELWGRYTIADRFQLYAVLPYRFVHRRETDLDQRFDGLGDLSVLLHYSFIDHSSVVSDWKHLLQAGGGIKLPTGPYRIIRDQNTVPAPLQPGTGSFDYLGTLIYVLRYKSTGISTDLNYRYNGTNKVKYHFGDRINAGAKIFYLIKAGEAAFLPNAGLAYERSAKNTSYGKVIEETGGENLSAALGMDFYYDRFSLGINTNIPLKQGLNNGLTRLKSNFQINLNYFF